jgi:copper(I)-binding protein
MSSPVLTAAATVQCVHAGTVALTAGQQALAVDGHPVLLYADLNGATITGCTTPATNNSAPCTAVVSVLAGAAMKLAVHGGRVATAQAQGLTNGVPPGGTWQVIDAGQTKLVTS